MSCDSCSSHIQDKKSCSKTQVCGVSSCGNHKLSVFDWLSNIPLPSNMKKFDCVEVRFKNSRKEFFRNSDNLPLQIGDIVATEAASGHDIGVVSLTGELVRVQMNKKKANPNDEKLPKIYRKANQRDIDVWQEFREKEVPVQKKSRELAIALGLEMKISDVEYQGDGSKATFYYTAEGRVDFRQLIKDMAREFSTRIEMRQIGFRQEAARLGGIGSCGRELCCSTWLTDFRSVTTAAARYQQLSLNPQKLAGQCGKLKCCLNFELDTYLDALQDFPRTDTKLQTEKGIASCQKVDIFKRLMWFTYENDFINWHKLTVDQVKEIMELNAKNELIPSLEDYSAELLPSKGINFEVAQESITRFDEVKSRKKKSKNKNNSADKKKEVVKNKEQNTLPPKTKEDKNKEQKNLPKTEKKPEEKINSQEQKAKPKPNKKPKFKNQNKNFNKKGNPKNEKE
ncbi:MAG: regulatory iron-sulfur-containing complex subunit RicT [Capnocytophaga sp.]|nr:regulatory iron-sulfur-containing complex subunit RicT [Capnocytophaga sp.]